MPRAFASRADVAAKAVTFARLSDNAYAYTAEGDPNTGVVVSDAGVLVVDAQATPLMAEDVIGRIREVSDQPIRYVVLSHYHAVRVLGASAYRAQEVIASRATLEMIRERGAQDMRSEIERFPRLFRAVESIPGLTWPTLTFERSMTLWLGGLEVQIIHPGRGHTRGDTVVWLPQQRVLFAGDLVECGVAAYAGDAQLADWPKTLDALRALEPATLVPGRGPALRTPAECEQAFRFTQTFVTELYECARRGVAAGESLREVYAETRRRMDPEFADAVIYEHCMPFDVARAFDEASGIEHPRIWTAERDQEIWAALQHEQPGTAR